MTWLNGFLLYLVVLLSCLFVWHGCASADSQAVYIQVRFCLDTPQGNYCDALHFTQAEYAALTTPQINAQRNARVQAWRQSVIDRPPAPVLTKAQMQEAVAEHDRENVGRAARRQAWLDAIAAQGG